MGFNDVWTRVQELTGWNKYTEMTRGIGIMSQSITGAKNRDSFPIEWAHKVAIKFNSTTEWLLSGEGPRHRDDHGHSQSAEGQDHYGPDRQCEWDRQLMGNIIEWLEEGLEKFNLKIIPVEKRKLLLKLYDIYNEEDEAVTRKDIHRDLKLVIGV